MLNFDFDPVKEGNTMNEVTFRAFADDAHEAPFDLTGCKVLMCVRRSARDGVELSLSSDNNSGIDLTANAFTVKSRRITLPAYSYRYEIVIRFTDGTEKTMFGGSFSVTASIAKL